MSPVSLEAIYAVKIFRDLTVAVTGFCFLFFFPLTPFVILHLKDSMNSVQVFSQS